MVPARKSGSNVILIHPRLVIKDDIQGQHTKSTNKGNIAVICGYCEAKIPGVNLEMD